MPRAPKYTRKQQKQLRRQEAKENYERGSHQDFPGAPVWNEWLQTQQETKRREISLPRRIGRGALEIAAVSVIAAKSLSGITG